LKTIFLKINSPLICPAPQARQNFIFVKTLFHFQGYFINLVRCFTETQNNTVALVALGLPTWAYL